MFAKKGTEPKKFLKEFRVDNVSDYKEGNEIGIELFKDQKFVDITSKTAENNFIPFYSFGETVADGIGLPRQMFWVSAFLITGLLLSIGVIMGTGSTPLAMVTMGMVLSFGTISGLYAQWFVVLFCAIMVLLWTSIKFMEETA